MSLLLLLPARAQTTITLKANNPFNVSNSTYTKSTCTDATSGLSFAVNVSNSGGGAFQFSKGLNKSGNGGNYFIVTANTKNKVITKIVFKGANGSGAIIHAAHGTTAYTVPSDKLLTALIGTAFNDHTQGATAADLSYDVNDMYFGMYNDANGALFKCTSIEVTYTDQVLEKKNVTLTPADPMPELEAEGDAIAFDKFVTATVDGEDNAEAQNAIMIYTNPERTSTESDFIRINNTEKTITGLAATAEPVTLYSYVPESSKFNATTENTEFQVTVKPAPIVVAQPVFTVNDEPLTESSITLYAGDVVKATCSSVYDSLTLKLNGTEVSNPYAIKEATGSVLTFVATSTREGADPASKTSELTVTVAEKPLNEILDTNSFDLSGNTYTLYDATSTLDSSIIYYAKASLNKVLQINTSNSTTDNKINSGIISTGNKNGLVVDKIIITKNGGTGDLIIKMTNTEPKVNGSVTQTNTSVGVTSDATATTISRKTGETGDTYTYQPTSDFKYFHIATNAKAVQISKIEVYYKKATQKEPTKVTLGWSTDYTDNTMDLYLGQKIPVTAEARKADNVKCEDANISYSSADPTIVSVSNNELTPADNTAAGKTTTITASLKEGDDYVYADGAGDITLTVNVKKSDVTISKVAGVSTDMTVNGTTYIDELVGVSIHGNQEMLNPAKAALTCVVTNGADLVEIKGDLITAKKAGEVTLMFAVPEAEKYNASNELEVNLTINKIAAGIKYDTDEVIGYLHEASDELPVLSNPNALDVTYTSEDPYVASVDKNGNVTIRHIGTTIITASFNGNDVYTADEDMYMLDVKLKADPAEGGPVVYEPAVYDEYGNLLIGDNYQIDNVIVQTDFITIEHEPGAKIYYRYTNKGEQGTNRPMMAQGDFTDATSETSDYHTVVTNDETTNTRVKYYPYGKPGTYDRWNNGELELYAEKDGVQSDHRTIAFDTPTSVDGIEAEGNGEVEYFNLQGVKVQNPEKGIYIRVQDGNAVKIVK